jgi:hypothetical protein
MIVKILIAVLSGLKTNGDPAAMSALGHKQTFALQWAMSALRPKQASGDAAKCGQNTASGSLEARCVTPTPKPKIPLTIWVMLGAVILFALLISYFLVVGVYDITARGLS